MSGCSKNVKGEGDNPTIGIILCTDKDQTIVKYSVLNESRQLFASKYKLYLPTEEELSGRTGAREKAMIVKGAGGIVRSRKMSIAEEDWQSIEFPETIRKVNIGRENQVFASDIMPSGQFPVVDQGQAFIAGYSDAAERVIRDDLPLVIFGDHTRSIKYVDFPFILGADGTKSK